MPANGPNIIVILSDQLRRDALGVYGDRNVRTPHIDRLAEGGTRFTNACSTYPICVPFRFSLMTGQYAHTRFVPGIEWRMSPAERTLADEFNDAGYETVYLGKWHLYGDPWHVKDDAPPPDPDRKINLIRVPRAHQGLFQKWYGFEMRNDPLDTYYFEDDDPTPRPLRGYQTDALFDLAMGHIAARDASRPFFAIVSVEPPHPPYVAPPPYEQRWKDRELILPPNFMVPFDIAPIGDLYHGAFARTHRREAILAQRRLYYAMIENLDDNVGRLTAFLAARSLADNTLIVFIGDHGNLQGCHGLMGKQFPFEESVGIPLIVSRAGADSPAGKTIDAPTHTEDLFPTLLGLAGLRPRAAVPGADLSPLVRGEADDLDREGVLLEFVDETRRGAAFHERLWRAFRSRRYKYIALGGPSGARPWQFFDLRLDPYELTNRLDDPACADEVRRHHALLREAILSTGDHFVLSPAFGIDGANPWMPTAGDRT